MASNFRCPTCGQMYVKETDLLTNRSELIPTCDCKNDKMEITRQHHFDTSPCGNCGKEYGDLGFKDMFDQIETYHKKLGQHPATDSDMQRIQRFRNQALAVMMELAELVDSLPWKPWRGLNQCKWDKDNACREIVDIIFFLVALSETVGITPEELIAKFNWVIDHNYERIANGYSSKGGDV